LQEIRKFAMTWAWRRLESTAECTQPASRESGDMCMN